MTTALERDGIRGEVWVMLAAAVAAIVIGTVARGFSNVAWDITANSLMASLGGSLPFLVAAGVFFGIDGWPTGHRLLAAGAWLLAIHGAISVAVQAAFVGPLGGGGPEGVQPWLPIGATVGSFAVALAFAALAVALWRMPAADGNGRLAIAIGVMLGIASLAPLAGFLAFGQPAYPQWGLELVRPTLALLATAGLAVAATRRIDRTARLREPLIALGAAVSVLAAGFFWFMVSGLFDPASATDALGIERPFSVLGTLSMAAGFAAAALPASDKG
jgi:hypothetical protein